MPAKCGYSLLCKHQSGDSAHEPWLYLNNMEYKENVRQSCETIGEESGLSEKF